MALKSKITLVVTESMEKELRQRLASDGYGLKEKSRWVSEAIEQLLYSENYPDLVEISQQMSCFNKKVSIDIPPSLKVKLKKASIKVRKKYPVLDGVQSCIVRTAIIQRFIRGYNKTN